MEQRPEPTVQIGVADPILRRALIDLVRVQRLTHLEILDLSAPRDLNLDEMEGQVRLGAIMDWILSRLQIKNRNYPPVLNLAQGEMKVESGIFTRTSLSTGERTDIRLTARERDLILGLYLAPEKFMGRDEILRDIWGYVEGLETHTLETHIYRLRQKIEIDPSQPATILTVPGGYKLAVRTS